MKKMLSLILSALVMLTSFMFFFEVSAVQDKDISKTRIASSSTYYEFDAQTKTLTISGSGATPNMSNNGAAQPWLDWRSNGSIEKVVVEEGITSSEIIFYIR